MNDKHAPEWARYLLHKKTRHKQWANPLRASVTVRQVIQCGANIFISSTKFSQSKHAKAQWVLMTHKAVVALYKIRIGGIPLIPSFFLHFVTPYLVHTWYFFRNLETLLNLTFWPFEQQQVDPHWRNLDRLLKRKPNKPLFWFLSKICEVRMTGH